MDLDTVLLAVLIPVDVVLIMILVMGINAFRKSIFDFEKWTDGTTKLNDHEKEDFNWFVFWVLILLVIVFVRSITPSAYL